MATRFEPIMISRAEQIDLWVTECGACGVIFAMPERLYRARREDGKSFHCPNGHARVFRQTETDRLTQELEAARRATADAREDVAYERRQHAATKGTLTKTLKRVNAGVCVQCNRTFSQLQRHMKSKHAALTAGSGADGDA